MEDPSAPPSFDALLQDILENPEHVFDKSITPAQILELQKRLNPYAYVIGDPKGGKRVAAVSCTNLRADYIQRFTMTALIGFLFRVLDEWEAPAASRQWFSEKERAEEAARRSRPAFTPDELLLRAEALRELALIAKEADAAAKAGAAGGGQGVAAPPPPVEEAEEVDEEGKEKEVEKVEGKEEVVEEGGKEEAVGKKEEEGQEEEAKEGHEEEVEKEGGPPVRLEEGGPAAPADANADLAKARGLLYAATYELRRFGLEADERIEAAAAAARLHPEAAAVIDRNPLRRPAPGLNEMPADAAKRLISSFLRTWFEYNPDAHVRSGYDEAAIKKDVAPAQIEGLGEAPHDKTDPPRLPLAALRTPPRDMTASERETVEALTATREAFTASAFMLRNEEVARALLVALAEPEKFRRFLAPIAPDSPARPAIDVIPPQDTFHRWRYYMEVNYEELRAATDTLYHEKPDLDWAIIIYDLFEGSSSEVDAAFERFRGMHQDEVISDIKGIEVGGWTLLGDFKENRAKINFYNKHTGVLKRILDRHAEDKKLGQDLMRNRVRQFKAKNIREDGPDAPGLAAYKDQQGPTLANLGAERVISREEMYRLERAKGNIRAAKELEVLDNCRQTIEDLTAAAETRPLKPEEERRLKEARTDIVRAQEMIEVPEGAIQVDVWTHDTASGGFGKSSFYTKAEAPPEDRPAGHQAGGGGSPPFGAAD